MLSLTNYADFHWMLYCESVKTLVWKCPFLSAIFAWHTRVTTLIFHFSHHIALQIRTEHFTAVEHNSDWFSSFYSFLENSLTTTSTRQQTIYSSKWHAGSEYKFASQNRQWQINSSSNVYKILIWLMLYILLLLWLHWYTYTLGVLSLIHISEPTRRA